MPGICSRWSPVTASHTNSPRTDRPRTRGTGRLFHALTLSLAAATVVGAAVIPAGGASAETAVPADTTAAPAATNTATVARSVTLIVGGRSRAVTTYASTVDQLLSTERVSLRPGDLVSPDRAASLASVSSVRVVRVGAKTVAGARRLYAKPILRRSAKLAKGQRVFASPGRVGRYSIKVRVVYHDGRVWSKRIIARKVIKPVPAVILVGTSSWPVDNRLHWSALARCESGGNPRIVSSNGQFYGLYQFTVGTWNGVGGKGLPSQASAAEQTYRAQLLYNARGRSPWPVCGQYL